MFFQNIPMSEGDCRVRRAGAVIFCRMAYYFVIGWVGKPSATRLILF